MNLQRFFISFLVVVFLLFFVLNITYFDKWKSNQDIVNIWENYIWYSEIVNSWTTFDFKKVDFNEIQTNWLYVENLNLVDRVYFSNWKFQKTQNNRNVEFKLEKWIFLFDIYDLSYNYSILDEWFLLKPRSPWKIFVDNRNASDIKIFSFDSIVDFSLLAQNWSETMTNIVLYPRMFFWFNSARNKFLKNADLLRLETITRVFYISEKLLSWDNLNPTFFSKIYSNKDQKVDDFFKTFFSINFSKNEIEKYDLENIKLYKWNDVFWLSYINKYFIFFLNKEKKISYYKKDIIWNLNKLFKKDLEKSQLNSIKTNVLSDLENIKTLDEKEYNDFNIVLSYYYKNLVNINSIDYIDNVLTLSDILISNSQVKKSFTLSKSSFYLNKIYFLLNNWTFSQDYIQKNLMSYLEYFMVDNKINFKDNISTFELWDDKTLLLKLDYLSFFLKNILLYDITFKNQNDFDNILNILASYFYINKNINFYNNSPLKSETLIVEYSSIISKIIWEIRKEYFEKDLNERELLVLSKQKTLNTTSVDKLNSTLNLFFNFWNSKKSLLSTKNLNYNKIYKNNKTKFLEYYSALSNYWEYLIKYDKTKTSLLWTKTVLEIWQEVVLSQDALTQYLSKFEWLDYSNLSYKIFNNDFYSISNLLINGENFSFNLYPRQFNRISNIIRSWKKLNLSYELDNLEYDWNKKYLEVSEDEKEKYDFKKFFINTFFENNKQTSNTFTYENDVKTDDRAVSLFKRDKLLWDKWEFSVLKWFFTVLYNDVDVVLDVNDYNIKINKWIINSNYNWENIIVFVKSDYVFSDTNHYFKNIKMTFYDSKWEKAFFDWKEFRVFWTVNILDFKTKMTKEIEKVFSSN